MAKSKILKKDFDWSDYPRIKDGAQLMLMRTAEGDELKAPEKAIKFVEIFLLKKKQKLYRKDWT